MSINFPAGSYNWPTSEPTLALEPATRDDVVLIADIAAGESLTYHEASNSATLRFPWESGDPENGGRVLTGRLLSTGYAVAVAAGGPVLSTLLSIQAGAGYSYAIDPPSQDGDR